jgi:hypothetical protein
MYVETRTLGSPITLIRSSSGGDSVPATTSGRVRRCRCWGRGGRRDNWWPLLYVIGVILFILGGIGFKPAGDRVHLVSLGLAAVFFAVAWNALAAT